MPHSRPLALFAAAALAAACAGPSASGTAASGTANSASPSTGGPRIIQPGAPGEAGRTISASELAATEGASYTPPDTYFMQGMIPHHAQALEMTDLVRRYASTEAVQRMGLRMEISQGDEIAMMQGWLRAHGEPIEIPGMGSMPMMPGMLSAEQMGNLSRARGIEFDRLFLEYMIQHHQGAIDMVDVLFNTSGAAQESTVFKFAEDVHADQTMEIERMEGLLADMR